MKLPKLTRKKGPKGKYTGNYLCKVRGVQVNLGTKVLDGPEGAIARSEQALKGRTNFRDDIDTVVDQMERAPAIAAAPAAAPPAASSPPPPAPPAAPAAAPAIPDAVIPPAEPRLLLVAIPNDAAEEAAATSAAAEETAGAGAAADEATGGGAAAADQEVSVDELAGLAVEGQIWVAAEWVRYKVYRGFGTPEIAEQGKKQLAAQWEKIIKYSGTAAMLPPWVTGALIPGAILLTATLSMARAFADAAKEQKRTAETARDIPAAA